MIEKDAGAWAGLAEALTYDSLVSDVQVYSERSDDVFVNQIPRFIMLAENRIASETRQLGSQQQVTGSLTTNVLPKPERWRETTMTSRVKRHLYHSTGWRETLAAWFCFNLLNAFDPSGKHC